ncbi:MAG: tetratricopeptide repeat protein [Bacteriovoracaceae bacterium]|nr:tetratricopeptide repeat protein [Bacteriovoracaceae bacterium]
MVLYNQIDRKYISLVDEFDLLKVVGEDSSRFLSGQLTNNLDDIENGQFQLQARLDRGGKLKSFFYLLRDELDFYILILKDFTKELQEDLQKYIIMDDVEITCCEREIWLVFSAYENPKKEFELERVFSGSYGFYPAFLTFDKPDTSNLTPILKEDFNVWSILQGEPVNGVTAQVDVLVTDTIVNLQGVSLDKGCYLGQETVSKIETRRGGAYFPVLLNVSAGDFEKLRIGEVLKIADRKAGVVLWKGGFNEEKIVIVSLIRDFRIEGRCLDLNINSNKISGTVAYLPFYKFAGKVALVEDLYEEAVKTFHGEDDLGAIEKFEEILKIDPMNEDSFEAIGVIFGRMEKFEEGISFMDEVLKANPDSVMAHTNKSLFYMRLGEIEKAEEEKAQATVKTFGSFGKEAERKKLEEEKEKQAQADIQRRFEMFNQVLEIDPDDSLANYGLADIYYQRGDSVKSIPLLLKVISENQKYSVGYLLLGKCYLELNKMKEAKEIFEKGILVASAQGDLMPANEMQAKLTSLL